MHPTYQRILDLLGTSFPNKRKINLIDYGCGNGLLLEYLSKEKLLKYRGLDVNSESINYAKNHYKSKRIHFELIQQGKPINLGKPKSIDAIVLIGVLQYLSETEINYLLTQFNKILKKNGMLIISCAVNHWPYRLFNLYRLFLPNRFIDKKLFLNQIKSKSFKISLSEEKGLLLTPIFSNIFVLLFDLLDKLIFRTQGKLGPIGLISRQTINPILAVEYLLPINYGYTLFLKASKFLDSKKVYNTS